jgi:hypothetical protein
MELELHQVPYFQLFYFNPNHEENIRRLFSNQYCNGDYNTATETQRSNYDHNIHKAFSLWYDALTVFMAMRGYKEQWVPKDEMSKWLAGNPGVPYLVKGKTLRGRKHIVIYKDGELHHDPHPSNEGLSELNEEPFSILIKE